MQANDSTTTPEFEIVDGPAAPHFEVVDGPVAPAPRKRYELAQQYQKANNLPGVPRPTIDLSAGIEDQPRIDLSAGIEDGSSTPAPRKLAEKFQKDNNLPGVPRPASALDYAVPSSLPGGVGGFFPERTPKTPAKVAPYDWQRAVVGGATDIATGGHPGDMANPPLGEEMAKGVREMETPGKRGTGALRVAATGTEALTPFMGPAAIENPLSIARGLAEGTAASAVAGYGAKKAGFSPENVENVKSLAFWAPGVARSVIDPKIGVESSPEGTRAGVTVAGGRAGAGVAVTPESVTVRGKVGPLEGSKTFSRGPAAGPAIQAPTIEGQIAPPPPDPSATLIAEHDIVMQRAGRVAQGLPPLTPEETPPAPPLPPPISASPNAPASVRKGSLSSDDVAQVAQMIAKLPPDIRNQAMQEAHGTLTKVLMEQGASGKPVVLPNGQMTIIKDQAAAEKVALQVMNDAVKDHDKAQAELGGGKPGAQGTAQPKTEAAPSRKTSRQKAEELAAPKFEISEAKAPKFEVVEPSGRAQGLTPGIESGNGTAENATVTPLAKMAEPSGTGISVAGPSPIHGQEQRTDRGTLGGQDIGSKTAGALSSPEERPAKVSGAAGTDNGFAKGDPVTFSRSVQVNKGQGKSGVIQPGTKAFIEFANPGMNFARVRLADGKVHSVPLRNLEKANEPAESRISSAATGEAKSTASDHVRAEGSKHEAVGAVGANVAHVEPGKSEGSAPVIGTELSKGAAEQVAPVKQERRSNLAERKRVEHMSPEEMKKELLVSHVVDLPNRRAFDEAGKSPAVAMSDADGLKALNDKFGYEAGNELLRAKAESLKQAGLDAYHEKGDEFLYRGNSAEELNSKLEKARELLRNRVIEVQMKDGSVRRFKGADFSRGSGQDIAAAESALKSHKSEREARGERARGELRGIAEVGPERSGVGKNPATEVSPAKDQEALDAKEESERLARIAANPRPVEVPGPGAKNVSTGKETAGAHLADLTESLKNATSPTNTVSERMRVGARIAETTENVKDKVTHALERASGAAAAAWDALRRPPQWEGFQELTRKWTGAQQFSNWESEKFAKAIKEAIPNKDRREAISNWIEAGGDQAVLKRRADQSKFMYKRGYDLALQLTDEERTIARNVMNYHDAILEEAKKAGILDEGVENYVQHIWEKDPGAARKVMAQINFNSLTPNPTFAKERTLPTYFDGEKLGFRPVDKDIGFITTAHNQAFEKAIASRAYIKSLFEGKAEDRRPLATISRASATELPPKDGAPNEAYLIRPNLRPREQYGDYQAFDHPALRKWRWADTDEETGARTFVQGDALLHPDVYQHVKNNLSRSAFQTWTVKVLGREIAPGRVALRASSEIKHVILSLSMFHEVTVRERAAEHGVFRPEPLDLNDPDQRFAVDHGLMVADFNAMQEFSEGVASSGIITKIPGIGPAYDSYLTHLFKRLIPELKMATFQKELPRNESRYPSMSRDQLGMKTADDVNETFGGLNYRALGRNPTFQDVLRLGLLAPDFLESSTKSEVKALGAIPGEAAHATGKVFGKDTGVPYGRGHLRAILVGAAALYTLVRLLNELTDGKPHWDTPFGVVYNGKEYAIRTRATDLLHAVSEPQKFLYGRLSPIARTGIEQSVGYDAQGHPSNLLGAAKEGVGEVAHGSKEVLKGNVREGAEEAARGIGKATGQNIPIPLQPFTSERGDQSVAEKAVESMLKVVGVNVKKFHSPVEEEIYKISKEHGTHGEFTQQERDRYYGRKRALEGLRSGNSKAFEEELEKGTIRPDEISALIRRAAGSALYDSVYGFTYEETKRVFDKAVETKDEEAQQELLPLLLAKQERLLNQGRYEETGVQ